MPENNRQPIDLATLYEITRALASSDDLRKCLEESLTVLAARTSLGNGAVTIANPLTGQIETEVAPGMTAEARKRGIYKFGEGITGRVVASGAPIVVPQISQEPLFLNKTRVRGEKSQDALSFLCVPIKHGAKTIGALSVDRSYHEGLDFEKDLQFLTVLSGLIAQTVVRIQAVNQERERLVQENTQLRRELSEKYRVASIVSNSNRMQEVFEMIHRVADSNATILLRGES
ncbi:MAG: GAF domain-containing protein, partial [Desulfurivibrionaceae bacterium]|nr:GAF domain-containing protein [Desulfurivibrionaceae bacterium]